MSSNYLLFRPFFDLCCCHKTMTKPSSLSFCGFLVFVVALRHKKTTRSSNSSSSHGLFMFCYYLKTKFIVVS